MEFIDFHIHIFPEFIAAKAADSIRTMGSFGNDAMDGTKEMLLRQTKNLHMARYVVLPVAVRADKTRHINNFAIEQQRTDTRFLSFGTIHAEMEHPADEVAYIMENGLHGLKLHPDSQGFAIDDERLFPAYEQVQGKIPVLFHMGNHGYNYSRPARLRRVLELFPRLQVIAAHFGGHGMYEEAYTQLKDKDCFLDVSSSLMFMEEGMAEKYISRYGAERFVYGSDYPMWDPEEEMARFMKLKLTDTQREQIAHKTAETILHL